MDVIPETTSVGDFDGEKAVVVAKDGEFEREQGRGGPAQVDVEAGD